MARILIVDDHPGARTTLRELLDWHSFQICGDAQNGKDFPHPPAILNTCPEIPFLEACGT